jgi:hypothetical protein
MTKEIVVEFAKRMAADILTDLEKQGWDKSKDKWIYFGRLARAINAMDDAMMDKSNEDVYEKAVSVANFAMIVANLHKKDTEPKGKVKRKK